MQFYFSEAAKQPEGLAALGLDFKSFLFQLITFLIVLYLLRRYVFSRLVETLESRRTVLENSLQQAKQTEEALNKANASAARIVKDARKQADTTLNEALTRAQNIIAEAESKGAVKAERIVEDARGQLQLEKAALSRELKKELAELVIVATEKVIQGKLDATHDKALIDTAVREIS